MLVQERNSLTIAASQQTELNSVLQFRFLALVFIAPDLLGKFSASAKLAVDAASSDHGIYRQVIDGAMRHLILALPLSQVHLNDFMLAGN